MASISKLLSTLLEAASRRSCFGFPVSVGSFQKSHRAHSQICTLLFFTANCTLTIRNDLRPFPSRSSLSCSIFFPPPPKEVFRRMLMRDHDGFGGEYNLEIRTKKMYSPRQMIRDLRSKDRGRIFHFPHLIVMLLPPSFLLQSGFLDDYTDADIGRDIPSERFWRSIHSAAFGNAITSGGGG